MILLVKFFANLERMGALEGAMLVNQVSWEKIQGRRWYASDVLGKYSEVWGEIGESEDWKTRELSDSQVNVLQEIFDFNLEKLEEDPENPWHIPMIKLGGFSPIEYIQEEE